MFSQPVFDRPNYIKGINIINTIVVVLTSIAMLTHLLFLETAWQSPILLGLFFFFSVAAISLYSNSRGLFKLSFPFLIFGNAAALGYIIINFGFFYHSFLILTTITIGSMFLYEEMKMRIFCLVFCLLYASWLSMYSIEYWSNTKVLTTGKMVGYVILDCLYSIALISIIYIVVAYERYITGYYQTRLEKDNQQLLEQKELIEIQKQQLQQLDQLKTQFFANISHELRTPITMMLGPINKVMQQQPVNTQNYQLLENAHKNSIQLLEMVDEILEVVRNNRPIIRLQEEFYDLHFEMQQQVADFQSLAQAKQLDLRLDIQAKKSYYFSIDVKKWHVIVKNLITNAIKFTPNGGKINVKVVAVGEELTLHVIDSGRGIHPRDLPNIFKRFYQAQHTNLIAQGGVGIGLAICKQYIEMMNGQITVNSELGKGTTFKITLPINEVKNIPQTSPSLLATKDTSSPKQLQSVSQQHSSDMEVLVVEDNPDICMYLRSILSPLADCKIVYDGSEALDYLATNTKLPDLIISDIMMPKIDGFTLLKTLKSEIRYSSIPVIMLTARIDMQDKLKALRIGVDDYLTKPFVEEELVARVTNAIQNYRNRKAFIQNQTTVNTTESSIPAQEKQQIASEDQAWLLALEKTVSESISNFDLTVEMIAEGMSTSRAQLFRRIKTLVGITPMEYIRQMRFNEARRLLETKKYSTVKAVSYSVGFKSERNFARNFKKRFGKYPSEYLS